MRQITVRHMDASTERALREIASREGISLNKAALRLMKAGSQGPARPARKIGHALDRFFGRWTKAEARAFDRAVEMFERVDPELWR